MKAHLSYLLYNLRESFWFVPTLMTLSAIALSMLTLTIDSFPATGIGSFLPWSDGLGLSNARLIMSTIAGSIITVASLVFSLTVLSLSLASGQLGPRLLTLFMRDRLTQTVHGTFIATFVFALLVLANLGDRSALVPKASIAVALLLTLLSFATLIAFIHHLARSLHADEAIARMAAQLDEQFTRLFGGGEGAEAGTRDSGRITADWAAAMQVPALSSGYVQTIDRDALVAIASDHATEVRLLYRAGHFVCRGEAIAELRSICDDDVGSSICACIVLGKKRTNAEDPEFALQAIVEIGLRALSPGINDPYTACACLDWLGDGIASALKGRLPDPSFCDAAGNARLHTVELTLAGLFDSAFNEIRQAAEGNEAVLIRLAETLQRLAAMADTSHERVVVRRHTEMLARTCARSIPDPEDQNDVHERLTAIDKLLEA